MVALHGVNQLTHGVVARGSKCFHQIGGDDQRVRRRRSTAQYLRCRATAIPVDASRTLQHSPCVSSELRRTQAERGQPIDLFGRRSSSWLTPATAASVLTWRSASWRLWAMRSLERTLSRAVAMARAVYRAGHRRRSPRGTRETRARTSSLLAVDNRSLLVRLECTPPVLDGRRRAGWWRPAPVLTRGSAAASHVARCAMSFS